MTFRIISEGSGHGVRRIEAVTGWEALQLAAREKNLLRIGAFADRTEPAQREGQRFNGAEQAPEELEAISHLPSRKEESSPGCKNTAAILSSGQDDGSSMDLLRENVDRFKDKFGSGVILLGAIQGEKVNFVAGVSKDLTAKIQAGTLVKQVAAIADGGGGGRPELAQAGGKNTAKLEEALCEGERLIRASLE